MYNLSIEALTFKRLISSSFSLSSSGRLAEGGNAEEGGEGERETASALVVVVVL